MVAALMANSFSRTVLSSPSTDPTHHGSIPVIRLPHGCSMCRQQCANAATSACP